MIMWNLNIVSRSISDCSSSKLSTVFYYLSNSFFLRFCPTTLMFCFTFTNLKFKTHSAPPAQNQTADRQFVSSSLMNIMEHSAAKETDFSLRIQWRVIKT